MVRFLAQFPRQVAFLRRFIRSQAIDAIYVNGPQVLPGAALAKAGRPLIFHAHWVVTQPVAAGLARHAARLSNAFVIATSESVARSVEAYIPRDQIQVVYNGIAGNNYQPRARGEALHVATLGRIAPEKGQLEFVRAARILSTTAPGLRFTVCGAPLFSSQGYFEQVRREAEGLPVAFPGWTHNVPQWLEDVDLLVVPSAASDNIPRVILEAFAAGVPVLAFPSGGIPELIENRSTGFLVHERSAESLAQAIAGAVRSPELLARISAAAHARWAKHFTLERFQSELCGTVEEAVRLHQRTPAQRAGRNAVA
jgi:glycosyltransferase involved in cell wall biosynthesis